MGLLICAATAKELAALAPGVFPSPDNLPEMSAFAQNLHGKEQLFLVTGIGPINAALALGECIGQNKKDSFKIEGVIYTGLAGAFDLERFPLRSICHVQKEIWPEYGLHDGITVTARAFKFPLWKKTNGEEIYDTIELACASELGLKEIPDKWKPCSSLTVAGVSASFARRDKLQNLYGADLENMEGFAAAYVSARAGLPCLEIRVVANKVGPRSRAEKDFDGALETMEQILPALNLTRR